MPGNFGRCILGAGDLPAPHPALLRHHHRPRESVRVTADIIGIAEKRQVGLQVAGDAQLVIFRAAATSGSPPQWWACSIRAGP